MILFLPFQLLDKDLTSAARLSPALTNDLTNDLTVLMFLVRCLTVHLLASELETWLLATWTKVIGCY